MEPRERRVRLEAAGQWLRERRRRKYPVAAAFARAIGVDGSQVSNYERGVHEVPAERVPVIAKVLGLDEIDVWRGLQRQMPDVESPVTGGAVSEIAELRALAADVGDPQRTAAMEHLDDIERLLARVRRAIDEGTGVGLGPLHIEPSARTSDQPQ
ncbi:MAG TPA: helix-turn-helix transcriptional regulator [Steroidobacteraceae bacterium]|nr:helix-turn-helix transcriptional regulator [Steroidobacteraceae bacterium]